MRIAFPLVRWTFSRRSCPPAHPAPVWIRRWITSTSATSVGVTSAPARRCRSTCAPTQATSPSSATSARRPSPPRGILRCDSWLPTEYRLPVLTPPRPDFHFLFPFFAGAHGYTHVDESHFTAWSSHVIGVAHATGTWTRTGRSANSRTGVHAAATRALLSLFATLLQWHATQGELLTAQGEYSSLLGDIYYH